ncbi:hypothetical protein [Chroococcidiopsis sp [FACHB-1243]]|nr:hypothetical protein [Chroococcidiopsis sp. [FACHB-1243]]
MHSTENVRSHSATTVASYQLAFAVQCSKLLKEYLMAIVPKNM